MIDDLKVMAEVSWLEPDQLITIIQLEGAKGSHAERLAHVSVDVDVGDEVHAGEDFDLEVDVDVDFNFGDSFAVYFNLNVLVDVYFSLNVLVDVCLI